MSTVTVDGTEYTELTDTVWADAPYSVRVQVGRELTPAEAEQLAGLVGYAYAKTGGERGNGFTQDSPNSIIYYCDTTKGRAYKRLEEFFEDVKVMAVEGSPPRKTKNNTRLVEGLGDLGGITFFADSVYDSSPKPPAPTYDARGFDARGVHRNGSAFDDEGFDDEGFDKNGFDRNGYDRDGRDAHGDLPFCEVDECDRDASPCTECGAAHCGAHPCEGKSPRPPLPVPLTSDGTPAPGIYSVGEKVFRIGKTNAASTFMGGKWRPQTAAESRDTAAKIKARGHKAPLEQVASLGRASGVCLVCGRALSDPGAIERGIGAKCVAKV